MANKHFTHFAILLLILAASVSGFAQTQQFVASAPNVDDPPYGMVSQVWNGSTSTIYIDHIDVTAALESTGGLLQFGIGYSRLEESQCTAATMMILDPLNGPTPSTDVSVRVSQQPCKPNGLTYGICLSNCGAPNATYNYTPTNVDANGKPLPNLATCWMTCTFDIPGGIAIPPNRGVTVYTAYLPAYSGWKGYAAVNFRGRR